MTANGTRTVMRDRSRTAAGDSSELQHFADKHGITLAQVRELVGRVGDGRQALEAAVQMLKI